MTASRQRVHVESPEIRAQILVDALLRGDADAHRKHRVSIRTIRRWRHEGDPDVAAAMGRLMAKAEEVWIAGTADLLDACMRKMKKIVDSIRDDDVEALAKIAGVVRVVGEVRLTKDALNAGNAGEDPEDEGDGEAPSGSAPSRSTPTVGQA